MKQPTEYIYYLHEGNNIPKYVGHTKTPVDRLEQHITEATRGNSSSMKCVWIRTVYADGGEIRLRVIDECPADQLDDTEYYWISEIEGQGYWLHNSNSGRRGAVINEVKLKADIAEHKRNKKKRKPIIAGTPATKQQIAEAEQLYRDNPEVFRELLMSRRKTR